MPRGRRPLPWIKLWFDMLNDVKMNRLSASEKWCWTGILLLAGQPPERGKLLLTDTEPMTIDDIANALRLTPEEIPALESCISKLIALKSLKWNSHCLEVINFKKRQEVYESDLPKDELTPNSLRNHSELTPTEGEGRGERKDSSPNGEEIHAQKPSLKDKKIERFNRFWKQYPKKKSKGQAEKTFYKINPDEQLLATMLATIERAKKSADWLKENGRYIPYPATWLNAKGWEDEYMTPQGGDSGIADKHSGPGEPLSRKPVHFDPSRRLR